MYKVSAHKFSDPEFIATFCHTMSNWREILAPSDFIVYGLLHFGAKWIMGSGTLAAFQISSLGIHLCHNLGKSQTDRPLVQNRFWGFKSTKKKWIYHTAGSFSTFSPTIHFATIELCFKNFTWFFDCQPMFQNK